MELIIHSPKSLGSALKHYRKTKHLTQHAAGEPFNLDQTTISTIENGVPGTRIDTIFRILASLGLEMVIRPKPTDQQKEGW